MKTPSAGLSARAASAGILRARRAIIKYLLGPFRFSVNQAAPLPATYTEGGAVGSLTVVDTESKASISGGKLQFAGGKAVPVNYGDPGVFGVNSFTRTIGRTFFADFLYTAGTAGTILGWSNVATSTPSTAGNFRVGVSLLETRSTGAALTFTNPVISTVYQLAVVLRSSGNFYFIKGGIYTNWTLLWVEAATTTTPLYAAVANFDNVGTVDNLRVVDLGTYDARFATDYGIALNRSTFTAANSTALTAITPEAGGAWTQNIGTFSILSNKVKVATIGVGQAIATVDAGAADVLAEVTYNTTTTFDCVLLVRYAAADNSCWMVQPSATGMILFEYDGTTFTNRASVGSLTNTTGTDYRIVIVAEGSTISAYLNNANKISYASATRNQTLTKHGIRGSSTTSGGTWDDFIVWPRTVTLPAGI